MIDLLNEARQEAYTQGWADAVRKIMQATADAAPNKALRPQRQPAAEPPLPKIEANPAANRNTSKPGRDGRGPYGLCPKAIRVALDRAGNRGIDRDMVAAIGVEIGGWSLAESSIRSTMSKFEDEGEIERRGERWFKVETAGSASIATPAASTSATTHQGGPHETTLTTH